MRMWLFGLGGLLILWAAAPAALAMETAAKESGDAFATVWRIRGDVVADGPAAGRRLLREGDPVRVGERVRAAGSGEAVLKTRDAGAVAVRPGAEFVAERFVANGRPDDGSVLRIITGSLRLITGWIGRTNRAGHLVHTPNATIGIRGTDHEPYVMSAEMAAKTSYKEGTYDKVNRGRTALEVGENSLEIDPGKVGFVQTPPKAFSKKKRALLTMLMPVLLDKIPDFYVPGEFDAELDQYAEEAEAVGRRELERLGVALPAETAAAVAMPAAPVGEAATPPAAVPAAPTPPPAAACDTAAVGRAWLAALDGAISRLDAAAIVGAFAPDVVVRASVRGKDGGMSTVELGRDELARSTLAAVKSLEGYRHRRVSVESTLASLAPGDCDRVAIRSVVIEQGRQAGRPFRFESLEEYLIELRDGRWLAVKAETTQR
jgi:hypothetical protein